MSNRHNFLVVDLNKFRDPVSLALTTERCLCDGHQMLIADGAGFELSKGSKPLDTWRRSLSCLIDQPELVSVSRKLTLMLADEERTGRVATEIVDEHGTAGFRKLLSDISDRDSSSLYALVDGPVSDLMPSSAAAWSDSDNHKRWVMTVHGCLRKTFDESALRRLRKYPEVEIADWLSSDQGLRFVFQGIKSRGVADEHAITLSGSLSVLAAFYSSIAALALDWLAFGGLDDVAPDKISNDLHDLEYAILGSLSIDMISEDTRLNRVYRAVAASTPERCARLRRALAGGSDII